MSRLKRVKRVEAAVRALHPSPDPPGVVFVVEATADRPPGRWVRADGLTTVLVYDPAGAKPAERFPGNPLVLGGEIDPFARDAGWARGLRFEPA